MALLRAAADRSVVVVAARHAARRHVHRLNVRRSACERMTKAVGHKASAFRGGRGPGGVRLKGRAMPAEAASGRGWGTGVDEGAKLRGVVPCRVLSASSWMGYADPDDIVRGGRITCGASGSSAGSGGTSGGRRSATTSGRHRSKPKQEYNGVFILLLINFVIFLLDKQLGFTWISQNLYLHHAAPRAWQFVTGCFCHANFSHLSQNGVMLYLFGKQVEEMEGAGGVIAAYLCTGAAAMAASLFLQGQPAQGGVLGNLFKGGAGRAATNMVTLGASGAVFGMFTITVLLKLRQQSLRSMLEVAILAPFVWERIQQELQMQMAAGAAGAAAGTVVSHVSHIAGAIMGVLLVAATASLPEAQDADAGY